MSAIKVMDNYDVYAIYTYRLDAETEGSTGFRKPKARGCSARVQRGRY